MPLICPVTSVPDMPPNTILAREVPSTFPSAHKPDPAPRLLSHNDSKLIPLPSFEISPLKPTPPKALDYAPTSVHSSAATLTGDDSPNAANESDCCFQGNSNRVIYMDQQSCPNELNNSSFPSQANLVPFTSTTAPGKVIFGDGFHSEYSFVTGAGGYIDRLTSAGYIDQLAVPNSVFDRVSPPPAITANKSHFSMDTRTAAEMMPARCSLPNVRPMEDRLRQTGLGGDPPSRKQQGDKLSARSPRVYLMDDDDVLSLADLERNLSGAAFTVDYGRRARYHSGDDMVRDTKTRQIRSAEYGMDRRTQGRAGDRDMMRDSDSIGHGHRRVNNHRKVEDARRSMGRRRVSLESESCDISTHSNWRSRRRVMASRRWPAEMYGRMAALALPQNQYLESCPLSPIASRSMLTCNTEFKKQFPFVYQGLCKGILDIQKLLAHEVIIPVKEEVLLKRSMMRSRKAMTGAICDQLWRSLQGRFPDPAVTPKLIRKMAEYFYDKVEFGIQDAEDERSFLQWLFRLEVENAIDLRLNVTLLSGKNTVISTVEGSGRLKRKKGDFFNMISPDWLTLNIECSIKALFLNGGHLSEINTDSIFIDRVSAGANVFARQFVGY